MAAGGRVRLGPFELIEVVGRGGMAEVWSGEHLGQGVPVAIKVLASSSRTRLETFRNEARNAARLDHPAIVHVLDYGVVPEGHELTAGRPYLVMEYASRGSLRGRPPPLPWPEVREILLTLLGALAHAHARGVVHRDIKPGNVLLAGPEDTRPGLKLSDFGIARALHDSRAETHSMGTPHYMAPEQVRGTWQEIGPWTDLYSLGCLAWKLVTGNPPFRASQRRHVAVAHLRAPLPSLPPEASAPVGLEQWLWRMLGKHPLLRFRRAAEAREALLALDDRPLSAPEPPPAALETTTLTTTDIRAILEQSAEYLDPRPRAQVPRLSLPLEWRRPRTEHPMSLVGAGLGLYGLRTVPLVGRERERDRLWASLHQVEATGLARAVVLRGPAGTGKSRLAEWLAERAHEEGCAHVLRSDHGPGSGGLAAMLFRYLRAQGRTREQMLHRLERLLRFHGSDDPWEWAALTEYLFPSSDQGGEGSVRLRDVRDAWGALARFLHRLADSRLVVLTLDDVHDSPEATDFTRYLLDEHPRLRAVVVLTTRPTPREPVASLLTHDRVALVDVDPLDPDERPQLVRGLLGLDGHLAATVEERTAGNPLFAVQLVGDWVRRGVLIPGARGFVLREGEEAVLPDDIHSLWSARLEDMAASLEGQPLRVLEIAAALGPEVEGDLWHSAVDRAGLVVPEPLVDTLASARLAQGDEDRWSFVHGMLRESLERRARESGRWKSAHHAIAAAMRALRPEADEALAVHLLEAGAHAEAMEPLARALDQLLVRRSPRRALTLVRHQHDALTALGAPPDDPHWVELHLQEARAMLAMDELEGARAGAERAAAAARHGGDLRTLARALAVLGVVRRWQGDPPAAQGNLSRALELADRVGDEATALEVLRELALVSRLRGHLQEAWDLEQRALARLGDRGGATRATVLLDLAGVAWERRDLDQSEALAREALDLFEAEGVRWGEAGCHNALGDVARARSELEAAAVRYERAVELCKVIGYQRGALVPRVNLALTDLAAGEWAPALSRVEALVEECTRRGLRAHLTMVRAVELLARAGLGQWTDLDHTLSATRALLQETGVRESDLASCLVRAGELARAAGEARRASRVWRVARNQLRVLGQRDAAAAIQARLDAL